MGQGTRREGGQANRPAMGGSASGGPWGQRHGSNGGPAPPPAPLVWFQVFILRVTSQLMLMRFKSRNIARFLESRMESRHFVDEST